MELKIKICFTYILPFRDCIFPRDGFFYNLNSLRENVSWNEWNVFKKGGMCFICININSLFPKIDELHYIANITSVSVIRTRETKLDKTFVKWNRGWWFWFNWKFDCIQLQRQFFAVIPRLFLLTFFCLNLSQSYWLSYIDHPANQISLSTLMFSQKLVLDKQECYLQGNLIISLILDEKEIFSNKMYGTDSQNLPPLTNSYLEFFFSYSLEQLISIPNRVTSKTATLIDHVLTNFSQIVSQCSVIN